LKASYDLYSNEPIYLICYNKWFRRLMPLLPMKHFKPQVVVKQEISDWREAKRRGVLASYFLGHDEMYIFDEPIDTDYTYRYTGDYKDYVITEFNVQQRVDLIRAKFRRHNMVSLDIAIEACLEILESIKNFQQYRFEVYDVKEMPMAIALALRGCVYEVKTTSMVKNCLAYEYGLAEVSHRAHLDLNLDILLLNITQKQENCDGYKNVVLLKSIDRSVVDEIVLLVRNVGMLRSERVVYKNLRIEEEQNFDNVTVIADCQITVQQCAVCSNTFQESDSNITLCLDCLQERQIVTNYGLYCIDGVSADMHRQRFLSSILSVGQVLFVTNGMHWIHRRNGIYFYFRYQDLYYVIGTHLRRIVKLDIKEHWNGVNLFYFGSIVVGKYRLGVFKDRDKMMVHDIALEMCRRYRRYWELGDKKEIAKPKC